MFPVVPYGLFLVHYANLLLLYLSVCPLFYQRISVISTLLQLGKDLVTAVTALYNHQFIFKTMNLVNHISRHKLSISAMTMIHVNED